jgi:RimJ/RimL family protein N-acetyltransferase
VPPGGNDSIWMIPVNGGPRRPLAARINSWPAGWLAGPALAIVRSADDRLVGIMYFTARDEGSVEMTYGVALPTAARHCDPAARLAAAWLVREAGWHRVELRIADDAAASNRVAAKAGLPRQAGCGPGAVSGRGV